MDQQNKQVKTIQSVNRALDILEYLVDSGDGFSLSKIAEECCLNKTTAFHLLKTLESRGYVEQSYDTQNYKNGWKLYKIAAKTFDNLTVVQAAKPYMKQLFDKFNETTLLCHGAQVGGQKMAICLYQLESTAPLHTTLPVGSQLPLHCTSAGMTYLIGLPEDMLNNELRRELPTYTPKTIVEFDLLKEQLIKTKKQGYSIEYEEYQTGVCTVAVPIIKHTGRTVFSLVLSMPVQRASDERLNEMLVDMLPMARELSKLPF